MKLRMKKRVLSLVLATTMLWGLTTTAQAGVSAGNAIAWGIDVSQWQGAVNWGAVRSSGASFAFIKIGSTKSGVDPAFVANITAAQAAGMKTGVYLYSYATSVEAAINEANMVVAWLENFPVNLPVVYDIEDSSQKNLSPAILTAMSNAFCTVLDAAGYYPMVYANKNWFMNKIPGVAFDRWVAQYNTACDYPGPIAFWQASQTGSVAGIAGKVDIDYQYKDYSQLIIPVGFMPRPDGNVRFYYNYKMMRGWIPYNDTKYYADAAGNLVRNNWFADETGTYFLTADGSIARGQYPVAGANYYFDINGVRQIGWVPLPNGKFYYDPATAVMLVGWFTDGGKVYYLSPEDGHAMIGPAVIDGAEFFFDAEGVRQTGWLPFPTGNCYYDPATGAKVKGWFADQKGKYYLAPEDGHAVVGLQLIDKNQYLFGADGVLQTGLAAIGDGFYFFDQTTGIMAHGLCNDVAGNVYYAGKDGKLVSGLVPIEGVNYYFDPKTFALDMNTTLALQAQEAQAALEAQAAQAAAAGTKKKK